MLHLLEVSSVLCLVSISGELRAKNCHQKIGISTSSQVLLGNIAHVVICLFREKWEAGVCNQGIFRMIFYVLLASYVEIIIEAKISRVFSYPYVGVIFDQNNLSRSQKLADADPTGNLDSCSGTQNEQKNTQNVVIEAKIRTLST